MAILSLAADLMTVNLKTLRPDVHVFHGITELIRHNLSGAPVIDANRNYLGVFSEKCCMSVFALTAEASADSSNVPRARDVMAKRLVTLSPNDDVFQAIGVLLKNRVSGAPVMEGRDGFLGVFSERDSMRVVIDAAYEQLPTSEVRRYINRDHGREIDEDCSLRELTRIFLDTHYRRLVVVRDGHVVGQISRRDIIRAEHELAGPIEDWERRLLANHDQLQLSDHDGGILDKYPESNLLANFMDTRARTVTEDQDLLSIAQIFLQTNYRRLPVLRGGKLVGQISRRDVLRAAYGSMHFSEVSEPTPLFLSALGDSSTS